MSFDSLLIFEVILLGIFLALLCITPLIRRVVKHKQLLKGVEPSKRSLSQRSPTGEALISQERRRGQ